MTASLLDYYAVCTCTCTCTYTVQCNILYSGKVWQALQFDKLMVLKNAKPPNTNLCNYFNLQALQIFLSILAVHVYVVLYCDKLIILFRNQLLLEENGVDVDDLLQVSINSTCTCTCTVKYHE